MQTRKVQITGKSSYILTLPKKWINFHDIKVSQELGIIPQNDSTLVITPFLDHQIPEKIKEIYVSNADVSSQSQELQIHRRLVALYITGYSKVRIITDEDRISSSLHKVLTKFKNSVIGSEIIEESKNSVTIRNFLITNELKLLDNLKRMANSVGRMHFDLLHAINFRDPDGLEEIISRDNEIDKLNHYNTRVMVQLMTNTQLAARYDLSLPIAEAYFIISLYLEQIGDDATNLAKLSRLIIEKDLDQKSIIKIQKASNFMVEILDRSIEAWNHTDPSLASKCVENFTRLEKYCTEEIANLSADENCAHLDCILQNIRRTGKIAVNIALLTIDAEAFNENTFIQKD